MFAISSIASTCGNSLLNAFKVSTGALSAAFVNPVRYRYHEEKAEILKRRWGYKDKVDFRGLLPRVPTSKKLPLPPYIPKNVWSEKRALFGQNDYIDILGDDENIRPIKFAYGIPAWLRGFTGSEYHMLLRKRALFGRMFSAAYPRHAHLLKKRIRFLYRKINQKTKHYMDPKVMRR